MPRLSPPPIYSLIVNADNKANMDWQRWFNTLKQLLISTAGVVGTAAITGQGASVTTTPIATATLAPGLYRISYYARVTQAATASSSLAVTVRWVDGAAPCTVTSSAATGNTTSTVLSSSHLVRLDFGTEVEYATTYASSGITPMLYSLDVVVESLP
jgi:hypothetical protein